MILNDKSVHDLNQYIQTLLGKTVKEVKISSKRLQPMIGINFSTSVDPNELGYIAPSYSFWRLEMRDEILCGSGDTVEHIKPEVEKIIGERFVSISIEMPLFETEIKFSNNSILKMLPMYTEFDINNLKPHKVHWSAQVSNSEKLIVGPGSLWFIKSS
mgnify:CR=1